MAANENGSIGCIGLLDECNEDKLILQLKELLPTDSWGKCHVCCIEATDHGFRSTFRMTHRAVEDVKSVITSIEERGKATFRLTRSQQDMSAGKKNLLWAVYHCQSSNARLQHGVKNPHRKHTNCDAKMTVTLRVVAKKGRCQSKDPHMPKFPTIIVLNNSHNHQLNCADALKFRKVSKATEDKFEQLFTNHHSPSSALDVHKHDLQVQHGSNYFRFASDRSYCPDLQWCFRKYYKMFKKTYGASKDGLRKNLETKIEEINSNSSSTVIKMSHTGDQTVIAICTLLMQRVHRLLPHSAELVFMDSFGRMDRCNNRVFILLTHSCAGGLPLGILVTTSETEAAIEAGLKMLTELVGDEGFFGRGPNGPQVFMTDDLSAEQNAISSCFPQSVTILCIYHILRAMWRWLYDRKNNIAVQDRAPLLGLLKDMVFARTTEDLQEARHHSLNNCIATKYKNFQSYLDKVWERRNKWAVSLRADLPIRGSNTNDIAEAAFRAMHDKIFQHFRAFNIIQLIDFMVTRLEMFYERKILDIAAHRIDLSTVSRYRPPGEEVVSQMQITKIASDVFQVFCEASGNTYEVNTTLENCTCQVGKDGAPCEHQYSVVEKFGLSSFSFVLTNDSTTRKLLHQIATGITDIPDDWYATFTSPPSFHGGCPSEDAEMNVINEGHVNLPLYGEHLSDVIISQPQASKQLEKWNEFSKLIATKLETFPHVFDPVVATFLSNASTLRTDDELSSALAMFGKCESVRPASGMPFVQGTAIARRNASVGVRGCQPSGRSPNAARRGDHASSRKRKITKGDPVPLSS